MTFHRCVEITCAPRLDLRSFSMPLIFKHTSPALHSCKINPAELTREICFHSADFPSMNFRDSPAIPAPVTSHPLRRISQPPFTSNSNLDFRDFCLVPETPTKTRSSAKTTTTTTATKTSTNYPRRDIPHQIEKKMSEIFPLALVCSQMIAPEDARNLEKTSNVASSSSV